jgi:membrane-associated phospholipid phosphatase
MELIQWLQQSASPFLDTFWGIITDLNAGDFGLLIVAIYFWCINAWIGWLFGNIVIAALIGNDVIKSLFLQPRPTASQVRVLREDTAPGSSFPSGHTLYATVFWGYLAWLIKSPLAWLFAAIMVVLAGVSRLYLGLHWPGDILAGFAIGVLFLTLAIFLTDTWRRGSIHNLSPVIRVLLLVVPTIVFLLVPSKVTGVGAGMALGVNIGFLWLIPHTIGTFPVKVGMQSQIIKAVIGIAGLMMIRLLLKALLPETFLADFMRYCVLGLWVGWAAPAIFSLMFKTAPAPVADSALD